MNSAHTDPPKLPLSGIRVLDIAMFIAAPYSATLLADFGADVIKVELPKRGDSVRWLGVVKGNASMQWRFLSRNKRTITLDLRHERGAELLLELVKQADVVVENFTPGTLDRWNIGYERMREVNPGIVLMSVSGFGQTGPYRQRPAVARIAMAFGGLLNLVGEPGGPPLLPGVAALADYLSGVYGALGTMIALRHRERTGEGQQVDLALFEPVFHMLEDAVEAYGRYGIVKQRMGSANRSAAPHKNFESRDGKWIALGVSSDELFRRLCVAMRRQDLLELPRFKTNPLRVEHRVELEAIVAQWFGQRDAQDALRTLEDNTVPASLIYSMADIYEDEHYAAREAIIDVPTEDIGNLPMRGVIPRLTATPGRVMWAGPDIGHHNDSVYRELLGLDDDALAELRDDGVI